MLFTGVAALVTSAAIAGAGTLAAGYSSQGTSSGLSATTGSVTMVAGTGAANRLTTAVTAMEPGDTIKRAIDLVTSNNLLSTVTLTTTDTASGTKLSTSTDGLQMTVEWCSVAWTEHGSAPAYTYDACSGTHTTLIASRDVITTSSTLSGLNAESSGSTLPTTDHLLVTLALPVTSPNSAQSASSIINYAFTGVQPTTPKAR